MTQTTKPSERDDPNSGPHGADLGANFSFTNMPGDWSAYEDRISRVTAYIHDHLDKPLDLDRLAEIACLSRFHWHRIYRAIQGETVAQTLKRVRMTRAGFDLADGNGSLEAIGRRCGYPNQRSFSRAFSDVYGVSPSAYRALGRHIHFAEPNKEMNTLMYTVETKTLPALNTAGVLHKGSYYSIGESFEKLVGLASTRGLMPNIRGMVGIYYDDPMVTPEEELRSRASVIVDDVAVASYPLEAETLVGGTYAVLTHKGPYSDLPAAYDWLYSVWLKEQGHTLRAEPPYENYLNNPRDVAASELLTEICVPVAV